MDPEPVAEPAPAPASERPVRAAAQKAAQKKAEEAEATAKKKAAGGKASAAALQKKLAAQKEAASAVEAAQKARIEELEAELLRQQVRAAEAEASPRSAYGTPAKGQGHVSEENDNLEVELEAALGDEGEGAGEGASAPEPSPETEPPKTPEAVYELVAANAERFGELSYGQIVLLRQHTDGQGLIEYAKDLIEKWDRKVELQRQEAREAAKDKAARDLAMKAIGVSDQRVKMMGRWKCIETVDDTYVDPACADTYGCYRLYGHLLLSLNRLEHLARRPEDLRRW